MGKGTPICGSNDGGALLNVARSGLEDGNKSQPFIWKSMIECEILLQPKKKKEANYFLLNLLKHRSFNRGAETVTELHVSHRKDSSDTTNLRVQFLTTNFPLICEK